MCFILKSLGKFLKILLPRLQTSLIRLFGVVTRHQSFCFVLFLLSRWVHCVVKSENHCVVSVLFSTLGSVDFLRNASSDICQPMKLHPFGIFVFSELSGEILWYDKVEKHCSRPFCSSDSQSMVLWLLIRVTWNTSYSQTSGFSPRPPKSESHEGSAWMATSIKTFLDNSWLTRFTVTSIFSSTPPVTSLFSKIKDFPTTPPSHQPPSPSEFCP